MEIKFVEIGSATGISRHKVTVYVEDLNIHAFDYSYQDRKFNRKIDHESRNTFIEYLKRDYSSQANALIYKLIGKYLL